MRAGVFRLLICKLDWLWIEWGWLIFLSQFSTTTVLASLNHEMSWLPILPVSRCREPSRAHPLTSMKARAASRAGHILPVTRCQADAVELHQFPHCLLGSQRRVGRWSDVNLRHFVASIIAYILDAEGHVKSTVIGWRQAQLGVFELGVRQAVAEGIQWRHTVLVIPAITDEDALVVKSIVRKL